MKPGWQTSEFWIAIIGQVLALLALTGTINPGDREKLETALTNMITALFTIVASTIVVIRYIRSRSDLKALALATDDRRIPTGPLPVILPLLLIAGLFIAAPAQAAPPTAPSCLRIGRQQQQTDPALLAVLNQIAQNQQTIIGLLQQRQNAPPPVVILAPQQIPLGIAPRQDIPLGGSPRQEIPLGGPPKQEIPLGPPPRQDIPLGPAPRQDIPIAEPKPPEIKPAPVRSQRFSPAARR